MSSENFKYTIRDAVIYKEEAIKVIVDKLKSDKPLNIIDPETREEIVLNDSCRSMLLDYFKKLLLDL